MKPAKTILLLVLLVVAAAALVFVGINAADYFRYRRIMSLGGRLADADFRELVASVSSAKQAAYSGADLPAVFKKIGAQTLSIERFDDYGEIKARAVLYSRADPKDGDWTVNYTNAVLLFSITGQNQKIELRENFSGKPVFRTLWVGDPALYAKTDPKPIFTLHVINLGSPSRIRAGMWVVAKDAIIYSSGTTNETKPLTVFQSDAIGGALDMIPLQTYGKRFYDADIMHGSDMQIYFGSDGNATGRDIMVDNAWRPELEPLLNMLREFAPHGDEIPTKDVMVREYVRNGDPNAAPEKYIGNYQVQSVEEWAAWPPLVTDWWIVWPRLFLEKPKFVAKTPR